MTTDKKNTGRDYIPPILFFVISLIFVLPFLLKWNYIGVGDWELFATMAAVPAKTVLHFHQFPFWNPYLGGGNILFAHPEVGILSPFFVLLLIFGSIAGLKIQMMLAYFLGFWGSYLLARKLGLSGFASYLVSFTYFGSSYFALHFSIGHVPFTHFCFLPWFIYFLLKVSDNWKNVFGSAVAIALIVIGNGAAIPFLYTVFFSGIFVVLYSLEKKTSLFIKAYLFSVIAGLLLAAIKFIPMYYYLSQNSWAGRSDDFTPLALALKGLFSFNQIIFQNAHVDQHWGWHEYGAFISPIVVILSIAGLLFSFRRCRIWLMTAIFFFLFGLGNFMDISPWNLFMHLPGFSAIRSPARANQFVVFSIAIIAAYGLDSLVGKIKISEYSKKLTAGMIIGLIILTNFMVNLPAFKTIDYKIPEKAHFKREFRHVIGSADNIYNLFKQNRGSLSSPWLSAYKESRGLVTPNNEVMMEYVISGQLQVSGREYTPNRIEYDIVPATGGTIVFGIGYDDGWHSEDSRKVYETNGLVTTDFTVSDRRIILYYRPPYFVLGLIVSLLSIAGCLLFGLNRNFGKRFETVFK